MSRSVLSLHSRRLTAALSLALVSGALLAATAPAPAGAQTSGGGSLIAPAQTKEQAKAQAEPNPQNTTPDNGDNSSILLWLVIGGVVVLVGATVIVLRDAKGAVGGDGSRMAPDRPLDKDSVGRGVPKQMFEANSEIGGKQHRAKKRQQGKRQKAARRRNRPAR